MLQPSLRKASFHVRRRMRNVRQRRSQILQHVVAIGADKPPQQRSDAAQIFWGEAVRGGEQTNWQHPQKVPRADQQEPL